MHIFLKQRIIRIFDNGIGMGSKDLHAFASYFLSQKDRGLEPGVSDTHGFLDGNLPIFSSLLHSFLLILHIMIDGHNA